MEPLKINKWLVCITTSASYYEYDKMLKFLNMQKLTTHQLLTVITFGRNSFNKHEEIRQKLRYRFPGYKLLDLMSKVEPDVDATYASLEVALSPENYECGILLISEIPLAELFKPFTSIESRLQFGDKANMPGFDTNEDFLLDFNGKIKKSPNLVIFDAEVMKFYP